MGMTTFVGFCELAGLMILACSCSRLAARDLDKPIGLQCDSLAAPLGIDSQQPKFSWKLQDSRQSARQTAYQMQVASNPKSLNGDKADVWDSGRVVSDQSVGIPYGGPALQPTTRYYWRVRVWDQDGKA